MVLDIGCGTGFLFRQLEACGISCDYVGIDISPQMLEHFHPTGRACVERVTADIAGYHWHRNDPPDLIASIYCPLSFSAERWAVIHRLASEQKTGGALFLMLLNRYSLRRLLRLQLRSRGRYAPRERPENQKSGSVSDVEVFYDRPAEVRAAVAKAGYQVIYFGGDGPLSGVLEKTSLWPVNEWLGTRSPMLSYSMILIAKKILWHTQNVLTIWLSVMRLSSFRGAWLAEPALIRVPLLVYLALGVGGLRKVSSRARSSFSKVSTMKRISTNPSVTTAASAKEFRPDIPPASADTRVISPRSRGNPTFKVIPGTRPRRIPPLVMGTPISVAR
jgi:SAM-dependent methyltransferase